MSTDLDLTMTPLQSPLDVEIEGPADPVLHTAGDRPNTATLPALADPAADHVDPVLVDRREDVEEKHRRVIAFLDAHGYDALVLTRADSIAWFTSGGDLGREMTSEAAAVMLYINRNSRAVIADNVQSARVFEEEVAGLGFQLKERPWYDEPERIVAEMAHGRRAAADAPRLGLPDEHAALQPLRMALTRLERQRLRELGRTLSLAVEATCRNFQPGETEADVAGHLAHRLLREGVVPMDLRVAGDDRLARYRQPSFKAAPIRQRATIAATGRRLGLCAAVTRTVAFGHAGKDFQAAHNLAAMVDATLIYFSRPGETVAGAFRRARRIYEKYGHPDEWTLDYQGFQIGYAPREALLKPDSPQVLLGDSALCWSPSVGPARCEDTVAIDGRGFEVVTQAVHWPAMEVMVKGYPIARPGILVR